MRTVALAVLLFACVDSKGSGPAPKIVDPAAATDAAAAPSPPELDDASWLAEQRALLESMSIDALPKTPADPSNRVADDPAAAALGHWLFFEKSLSSNRQVACASCHEPTRYFTDGKALAQGVGQTDRNSPTVVASAYSPWLFWDGRRDSLWAQALAPFESAAEMNLSRTEVVQRVARDRRAAALFRDAFGEPLLAGVRGKLPERAGPFGETAVQDAWARLSESDRAAIDRDFARLGKALAAYQRLLVPGAGRFDDSVRALGAGLSAEERRGLRLFLDSARSQCLRCHNGPLFTNQAFHRIGTEYRPDGFPEFGRFLGLQAALLDPFNCLGKQSDAKPEDCRELRFVRRDHLDAETGKFKTPSLRGVGSTAPYMHDGRHPTLEAVVEHYRHPPPRGPDPATSHELFPIDLSDAEAAALVSFLKTLDGPVAAEARWLAAPSR